MTFNYLVSILPAGYNKFPLTKKISWPGTGYTHIWIEEAQEWQLLAETFDGGDIWESNIAD